MLTILLTLYVISTICAAYRGLYMANRFPIVGHLEISMFTLCVFLPVLNTAGMCCGIYHFFRGE
jgi:hypothetical protein